MTDNFRESEFPMSGLNVRFRSQPRHGMAESIQCISLPGLAFAATLIAAVTFSSSQSWANNNSATLAVADYALSTAIHSHPPQIVSAADVVNAIATPSVNHADLKIGINIGGDLRYPRLALFINELSYKETCVDFSTKKDQYPTALRCPATAIALWQELPGVLSRSREAVAAAATSGKAVSGSNVIRSFAGANLNFLKNPTFRSGRGGVVTLVANLKVDGMDARLHICILFPTTVAGIPSQVSCS
jgi:hypothetical protein